MLGRKTLEHNSYEGSFNGFYHINKSLGFIDHSVIFL